MKTAIFCQFIFQEKLATLMNCAISKSGVAASTFYWFHLLNWLVAFWPYKMYPKSECTEFSSNTCIDWVFSTSIFVRIYSGIKSKMIWVSSGGLLQITVWKMMKFSGTQKILREINFLIGFVISKFLELQLWSKWRFQSTKIDFT